MKKKNIALVGNPNSGKSTIFNKLTRQNQTVGNRSSVTVSKKVGLYSIDSNISVNLVDLPGIYNIDYIEEPSRDEKITIDYLMNESVDLIINIIDSVNLERGLYLTSQLLDLNIPMVFIVNRHDLAKKDGYQINTEILKTTFHTDLIIEFHKDTNNDKEIKKLIKKIINTPVELPATKLDYDIENALLDLQNLNSSSIQKNRWFYLRLLDEDPAIINNINSSKDFHKDLIKRSREFTKKIKENKGFDFDILVANARYQSVDQIVTLVKSIPDKDLSLNKKLDQVLLNKWLGLPIFFIIMYGVFVFSVQFSSLFVDFFDQLFGFLFVDYLKQELNVIHIPKPIVVLLTEGVGAGIQMVATFVPVVFALFFVLGFLEQSGYLTRVSFLMEKIMQFFNLPSKALVPLMLGIGCNVPAVMATRSLDSNRSRLVTMALIPFMSCGARLTVFTVFSTAFFSSDSSADVIFFLYIVGFIIALLTAFLLKNFLIEKKKESYIIDLSRYQLPQLKELIIFSFKKLLSFIKNSGKVIVLVMLFIKAIDVIMDDHSSSSFNPSLEKIGKMVTPVFAPMGFEEKHWPLVVSMFTGIIAKETILGVLDAVYTHGNEESEEDLVFIFGLKKAYKTISENISNLVNGKEKNVILNRASLNCLKEAFTNSSIIIAYLLFVLLYTPCVATLVVLYRESSLIWTTFITLWTTAIAYIVSTVFYQVSRFEIKDILFLSLITIMFFWLVKKIFILHKNYTSRFCNKG